MKLHHISRCNNVYRETIVILCDNIYKLQRSPQTVYIKAVSLETVANDSILLGLIVPVEL